MWTTRGVLTVSQDVDGFVVQVEEAVHAAPEVEQRPVAREDVGVELQVRRHVAETQQGSATPELGLERRRGRHGQAQSQSQSQSPAGAHAAIRHPTAPARRDEARGAKALPGKPNIDFSCTTRVHASAARLSRESAPQNQ